MKNFEDIFNKSLAAIDKWFDSKSPEEIEKKLKRYKGLNLKSITLTEYIERLDEFSSYKTTFKEVIKITADTNTDNYTSNDDYSLAA